MTQFHFNYISKVLSFLNFSDDIIKWVKILLYNFNAVINHCGNISKRFEVLRGCRQGDPIASYLFILCIEILAHKLRTDRNIEGFHVTENEDDLGYDVLEDEVALKHLLEIYADDLTIYMKPSSQNLCNVVNNLTNFYKLSGLKISVTKTKAVWFGSRSNSGEVLCPDLNLKWVAKFTLLGIEFDSSLEEMKTNFSEKIEKMEKVFSNWSYRHLSPFGKVTVIKSLGLSKLSHIALVMPTPTKDMIKKIETVFYNFLWSKKSEKVRREDTKLPVKYGGLGMPDIAKFWTAFKFSWLRRILNTQSFWPRIVLHNISKILNRKVSACDLLQLGSSKLVEISKQLKNPFWKQALHSATVVTEGAAFCYPEKIIDSPFFYNPLVIRNRAVKPADFPEIAPSATLATFFYPYTNTLMERNDFCNKNIVEISEEKYLDIRYTITAAVQKLKISPQRLNCVQFPQKPLLIDIALSTNKGCSQYYKIISKKSVLNNKIDIREAKWHAELNLTFSTQFWDNARRLYSTINFDNPLKWLQYQIVRNSLQTNYIVSHFKPNVPAFCTYCENPASSEKISHLFWICPIVNGFFREVFEFICSTGLIFAPSRNQFIFGYHDLDVSSPKNYIILVVKRYIWITKFKTKHLMLIVFKSLLKSYICDLKRIFEIQKKPEKFNEWSAVFNSL